MKPVKCKRKNNRGLLYDPSPTPHRPSKTSRSIRHAEAAAARCDKRLAEGWSHARAHLCYAAEMEAGHYVDPETVAEVA